MPKRYGDYDRVEPSEKYSPICPNCDRVMLVFPPVDRLLSLDEAATIWSVHRETIRLWIKRGWIRAFRPHPDSRHLRVSYSDLMRLDVLFGTKESITRVKGKNQQAEPLARKHSKKELKLNVDD